MLADPRPPTATEQRDRHPLEPRERQWFAAFDHARDDMGRGYVDSCRSASIHVFGPGALLP